MTDNSSDHDHYLAQEDPIKHIIREESSSSPSHTTLTADLSNANLSAADQLSDDNDGSFDTDIRNLAFPSLLYTPPPSSSSSYNNASPGRDKQLLHTDTLPSPSAPIEAALSALANEDKLYFIMTSAAKPIYSYKGDQAHLSSVMAAATALLAVSESLHHQSLRHIRAGRHIIAFLIRGPLCLVAVSALAEPPAVLRMQLSLLHFVLVSILTQKAIQTILTKDPGYDLAGRLLVGADVMLNSMIDSFFRDSPAALLGAYASLILPVDTRQIIHGALKVAVRESGSLFGVVSVGRKVICLTSSSNNISSNSSQLQPWDVLIILNFLHANRPSLQQSGESLVPLCLPQFNPDGHMHAYIKFLDNDNNSSASINKKKRRVAITLLTAGPPDMAALLVKSHMLNSAVECSSALKIASEAAQDDDHQDNDSDNRDDSNSDDNDSPPHFLQPSALPLSVGGGLPGISPLLHFSYKLSGHHTHNNQYVSGPPAPHAKHLYRDIIVAYSQMRAAMFDHAREKGVGPLQRYRYEVRKDYCLAASIGSEAEIFVALDRTVVAKMGMMSRGGEDATTTATSFTSSPAAEVGALLARLLGWLRERHSQLFSI
jgi:hypothetical protein